jgi:DNA polymerase-3 subunit epsilon
VRIALEDGIITDSEKKDIEEVQQLLSISNVDYKKLLNELNEKCGDYDIKNLKPEKVDLEGKTICFTGTFVSKIDGNPITRSFAEKIVSDKGMIIKMTVTKSLDFLITADPESMSGKAKKARKYGTRIISEPVFWRMIGIKVD